MTDEGPRVLVVDDDKAIRRFLRAALTEEGYRVHQAQTGREALQAVPGVRPDLVILDLGLPDMDGREVIARLREWSEVPIIILSVREHDSEKIGALDAGADDYLTKPFSVGELGARLRVLVRRSVSTGQEAVFEVDDLRIDFTRRTVTVANREVSLTPTEYDLLRVLVQHAGRVLTHHQLLRHVWGANYEPEPHLLRVNISNLRRKLEPVPSRPHYIATEPGVGYRLRAPA